MRSQKMAGRAYATVRYRYVDAREVNYVESSAVIPEEGNRSINR